MKNIKLLKGILIGFALGLATFLSGTYAINVIMAREVAYSSSMTSKQNVQDAIDELYGKASSCTKFKVPLTTYLIGKANEDSVVTYSTGNNKEMYTFSHSATSQTQALIDYRYIGANPHNYIKFNNEVWRIIGVIEGKVKIVKDTSIGNMSWDYKKTGVGSSVSDWGSNDWTDSQLMYMLNPESFTLKSGYTKSGNYIKDGKGNIIYQIGCNPASISSGASTYSCTKNTWNLNSTALSQVDTTKYYLGGHTTPENVTGAQFYNYERGTSVYSNRPTSWTGKVALMYVSDYLYTYALGVDNTCYSAPHNCATSSGKTNSWLYKGVNEWFLTPRSDSSNHAFLFLASSGRIYVGGGYSMPYGSEIRPSLYLKSNTRVIGGTGLQNDPYEIE